MELPVTLSTWSHSNALLWQWILAKVKHQTISRLHRCFSIYLLLIMTGHLYFLLLQLTSPKGEKKCKHTYWHWWLMIRSDTHEAREQMINYFVIALLISRAVSVWRMFWKQTLAYHLLVSDKQWSFQSCGLKYRFVKRYQVWQETSEVLVTVSLSLIHRVTWIRECLNSGKSLSDKSLLKVQGAWPRVWFLFII